jgi:hypothetical protein
VCRRRKFGKLDVPLLFLYSFDCLSVSLSLSFSASPSTSCPMRDISIQPSTITTSSQLPTCKDIYDASLRAGAVLIILGLFTYPRKNQKKNYQIPVAFFHSVACIMDHGDNCKTEIDIEHSIVHCSILTTMKLVARCKFSKSSRHMRTF